jgi:hypothetical protein
MANFAPLLLLLPSVAFAFMGFFAVDDFVSMLGLSSVSVAPFAFSVAGFSGAFLA